MEQLIAKHKEEYGHTPEVIVQVPGACTVLGSYADACRGWSLVGTDRSTLYVAISVRDDNMVRLFNATLNDRKRFPLNNIKFRKEDRWGNYPKGVIAMMSADNHEIPGLDITLKGRLLYADNQMVSTSSAIGTVLAVDHLLNLDLSFSATIRLVYQANTTFNSEPCRVSDLLTILNSGRDKLFFFDLQHVTYQERVFPFTEESPQYVALIVDSKIPPSAMREEIYYKKLDIEAAFEQLSEHYSGAFIRDFPESDITSRVVHLDEEARHNAQYVLMESQLVKDAANLLTPRDAPQLGKIFGRIQTGLRDLLEVTVPEIDWLIKRAGELDGCLGAVQVDNGFAGNIMVLLSKEALPSYIDRLEEYEHIFGFKPRWHIYGANDPARVVFPDD